MGGRDLARDLRNCNSNHNLKLNFLDSLCWNFALRDVLNKHAIVGYKLESCPIDCWGTIETPYAEQLEHVQLFHRVMTWRSCKQWHASIMHDGVDGSAILCNTDHACHLIYCTVPMAFHNIMYLQPLDNDW
jgi:hypothetical protein